MRSTALQAHLPSSRLSPGPVACARVSFHPAFGNGDHPHYGL